MARGKTDTARLWVYVRDDRPFGGSDPPAALFHYSQDRRGEHPQAHLAGWSGILQADAYGGIRKLSKDDRTPAPVREACCHAHVRRKFFELADIAAAARRKSRGGQAATVYPIAIEAVRRRDALFELPSSMPGRMVRSPGRRATMILPRRSVNRRRSGTPPQNRTNRLIYR